MGGPDNVFSWTHVRSNTVITNNSELALVDLMASDGGQYECLVENRAGRDNINVTLNGNFVNYYEYLTHVVLSAL